MLCPIRDMVEKRCTAVPDRVQKFSWRSTQQKWLTGERFNAEFPLPNDVFRLGLQSGDLLVYIYLQYQKGVRSDQCWPSYTTIGAAVGMSRKTVQKHIGALIDKGLSMLNTQQCLSTAKKSTAICSTRSYPLSKFCGSRRRFCWVRFIAINDNFDTDTAERNEFGFIVLLKNLMNETYSRDISRKVSSAIEAKERRGEFIGVHAPYGYRKSAENRHKLEPNPETVPMVREIFDLRMQGMGYAGIARRLNERGVLSPGAYLYQHGLSENDTYRDALWSAWNIKEILRNEVYLGHLTPTSPHSMRRWETNW